MTVIAADCDFRRFFHLLPPVKLGFSGEKLQSKKGVAFEKASREPPKLINVASGNPARKTFIGG